MFESIKLFYRRHYLITALVVLLFALLVAFVLMEYAIWFEGRGRTDFAIVALQSILTAIIIGVVITILERLATAEKNKELADEIDSRLKNTLNLQLAHGFRQIHESADEIEKINEIESGDIMWANTVIRNQNEIWRAIRRALERGVNVHLLLMHQDNKSQEYRAKYTCADDGDPERIKGTTEIYNRDLVRQQSNLLINYINYEKDKKIHNYKGNLYIRFYNDPPGLPLFILMSNDIVRAFSGFYLDSYSSALPYIEWSPRHEGGGVVKNLRSYFDKKWRFAEPGNVAKLTQDAPAEDA